MCDRGTHIHCLDPPLDKIPQNTNWYCKECIQCISCGKEVPPVQMRNDALWYNETIRMCEECHTLLNDGNFCDLCMKAYVDDEGENFIQCDDC
jgi:hypothetical protein